MARRDLIFRILFVLVLVLVPVLVIVIDLTTVDTDGLGWTENNMDESSFFIVELFHFPARGGSAIIKPALVFLGFARPRMCA